MHTKPTAFRYSSTLPGCCLGSKHAMGMRLFATLWVALCGIGSVFGSDASTPESADIGLGLLRIASQSPGQSLRLGLIPRTPSNLSAGSWEIYAGSTWVNVWADTSEYHLDFEALSSEIFVTYGVDSDWQVELDVVARTTFGGGMDGFIQEFHRAVGMDQGGREEVGKNDTEIHVDPSGSQPATDLGDSDLQGATEAHGRVTIQRSLFHGGEAPPSLVLALTAQMPLGTHSQYRGGNLDLGLDLAAAQRLGSCYGYVTVSYVRFGADQVYGIDLRRSSWNGLVGLEYRGTLAWSLIAQYMVSQGVATDYHVFSEASHEITGGAKVVLNRSVIAELGLIENVFVFDNSPDFGVHVALRARF